MAIVRARTMYVLLANSKAAARSTVRATFWGRSAFAHAYNLFSNAREYEAMRRPPIHCGTYIIICTCRSIAAIARQIAYTHT